MGFEVPSPGNKHIRQVKLGDRVFLEGAMESLVCEAADNQFEDLGQGRPNGTKRIHDRVLL